MTFLCDCFLLFFIQGVLHFNMKTTGGDKSTVNNYCFYPLQAHISWICVSIPLLNHIQQTVNTLLFHYVLPCIIYSNHLFVQGLIIEIYLTDRSYTSLSTVLITFYLITFLHAKFILMHKKITTHKLSLRFHAYNLDGNQFRWITSG